MQEAITTGEDVHEGTELGDIHDLALVDLTDLCSRRVEDQGDPSTGLLDGMTVDCTDSHRAYDAVVVDSDVRAGLLLERVDDLALRADDLTDLVDRNLHRHDLRSTQGDVVARLGDGVRHDLEDLKTGHLGLVQRLGQDI